jgi:hypothetical protein
MQTVICSRRWAYLQTLAPMGQFAVFTVFDLTPPGSGVCVVCIQCVWQFYLELPSFSPVIVVCVDATYNGYTPHRLKLCDQPGGDFTATDCVQYMI